MKCVWQRNGGGMERKALTEDIFFAVRAANFCTITEHEGIHRGSQ